MPGVIKSPRLKHWGLLALFAAVFAQTLCRLYGRDARTTNVKFAVSVAAITLIVAPMYVLFAKWTECTGTPNYLIGKTELYTSSILIFLWCIVIGILDRKAISVGTDGEVENANLYYFSWGCFFSSVLLFFHNSCEFYGRPDEVKNSVRYHMWIMMMTLNLILMSSAIPPKSLSNSLSRMRLYYAVGLGACTAVLSAGFVGMYHKMKVANNFLQLELIGSTLIVIAYSCGVFFITGAGEGSRIGNIYYSTWISFIIALGLLVNCVNNVNWDIIKNRIKRGQPVPAEENPENWAENV